MSELHQPTMLHSIIYVLVTNNFATLKELKEYYTIDEVLALYEAYLVSNYNKQIIQKGGNL